jgi:hypothetical protein
MYMTMRWISILFLLALLLPGCQVNLPAPETPEPTAAPQTPAAASPTTVLTPTVAVQPVATGTPEPEPTATPPTADGFLPDGSLLLMPVGEYGGSITSFAAEEDILYFTRGPGLVAYNIADPRQPQQIGEPFPLNWVGTGLAVQGSKLYMIDRESHLYLFDAAEPDSMYVAQVFEGAGDSSIILFEDWGFVTSDICIQGACTSEVKLFSLAELEGVSPVFPEGAVGPALPVTALLRTEGAVNRVFSDGTYAYVSHRKGLLIASLPDLQVVSQVSSQDAASAAYLHPYLYQAGWGSLQVIDVSDPASPVEIPSESMVSHPSAGVSVALSREYLFGFETFGEFGQCWSTLVAVELSFPDQPDAVALDDTISDFTCVQTMAAHQDLLLVLDWNGLHLLDVSEQAFPTLVSSFENLFGRVEVIHNGYGYGRSGVGLDTLTVTNLTNPEAIEQYGLFSPGWVSGIVQTGDFLFIPAWEDGLHVIDISEPTFPTSSIQVNREQLDGPGLDAALWGDRLFVARGERGAAVLDVSDPLEPVLLEGLASQASAWRLTSRVAAGEGFVLTLEEDWRDDVILGTLNIFARSNAGEMNSPTQWEIPQTFQVSDLTAGGTTAYLLTSGCWDGECQQLIHILDLQDPAQPQLLSSFTLPGFASSLTLHGELLFVAAHSAGVYAWNVSDPTRPVLAAQVQTPGSVVQTAVYGDLLVVSDAEGGVVVYRIALESLLVG